MEAYTPSVRRTLLITAFVLLLLLDLILVPMAVSLVLIGTTLGSFGIGHHTGLLGLTLFGLVIADVPIALTVGVFRAIRQEPRRRAQGVEFAVDAFGNPVGADAAGPSARS